MKHLKRRICDVEFDTHSPAHYQRGTLHIYFAAGYGWRVKDGGYNDPQPYASKEAAVMQYVYAMQQ